MYKFDRQLFMGAGEHSAAQCYDLISRLNNAFFTLSGLQQPHHWDHYPSQEQIDEIERNRKMDEEELNALAEDIVMALTGKKIKV